jgi:hypothetical protein
VIKRRIKQSKIERIIIIIYDYFYNILNKRVMVKIKIQKPTERMRTMARKSRKHPISKSLASLKREFAINEKKRKMRELKMRELKLQRERDEKPLVYIAVLSHGWFKKQGKKGIEESFKLPSNVTLVKYSEPSESLKLLDVDRINSRIKYLYDARGSSFKSRDTVDVVKKDANEELEYYITTVIQQNPKKAPEYQNLLYHRVITPYVLDPGAPVSDLELDFGREIFPYKMGFVELTGYDSKNITINLPEKTTLKDVVSKVSKKYFKRNIILFQMSCAEDFYEEQRRSTKGEARVSDTLSHSFKALTIGNVDKKEEEKGSLKVKPIKDFYKLSKNKKKNVGIVGSFLTKENAEKVLAETKKITPAWLYTCNT